jgi:hypothetical protein
LTVWSTLERREVEFVGGLLIEATGTLDAQERGEKPSYAHVDTFNLDPGGTLMVELTTDPT